MPATSRRPIGHNHDNETLCASCLRPVHVASVDRDGHCETCAIVIRIAGKVRCHGCGERFPVTALNSNACAACWAELEMRPEPQPCEDGPRGFSDYGYEF